MFRPWTLSTLLGLLAVTGLRISEALYLPAHDIDGDTGVLTVCKVKFGKSRLVPLHASTICGTIPSSGLSRVGICQALHPRILARKTRHSPSNAA
jgi:hypothetical protein